MVRMTLLDRCLLQRFLHAFAICFVAMFGLFVIVDAFANIDEFARASPGVWSLLGDMGTYYGYRTALFFNTLGCTVSVTAVVVVLALMIRHGELNPILSAGVPTYRLAWPLVWGTVGLNVLLIANQEWLIPRIAEELQLKPGLTASRSDRIRPVADYATGIQFAGGRIFWKTRKLIDAEFLLPVPEVTQGVTTTLLAKSATYHKSNAQDGRAGWLLRDVRPQYAEIQLTPLGRKTVLPGQAPDEIFIATDISYDQLKMGTRAYEFLSTRELLERLRNPAFGTISLRQQSLHLHQRLTRPLLNVLLVLAVVPLVVRKESRGLVFNLAWGGGVVVVVTALGQGASYLAEAGLLPLDVAVWGQVLVAGVLAAWCSGVIRT